MVGYAPISAPRMPGASVRVSIRPMVAVFRLLIPDGTVEFRLGIQVSVSGAWCGVDFLRSVATNIEIQVECAIVVGVALGQLCGGAPAGCIQRHR